MTIFPVNTPDTTVDHTWEATPLGVYRDTITLKSGTTRPAIWWVRTIMEELMTPFRRETVFLGILALRPHRGPRSVAGWHVAQQAGTRVELTRSGPLLAGRLVLTTGPRAVSLGLTVTPRNRFGAAVWRRTAPKHREAGSALLLGAWKCARSS